MRSIVSDINLISLAATSIEAHGFVLFSDDDLLSATEDDANEVIAEYATGALWRLPSHEVEFFEWLRKEDPDVWNDLWGDVQEAPYLISLAHLPDFIGGASGKYLIRDLQTQVNYYFTPEMLLMKESADFIAAVRTRLDERESLNVAQAFATEVSYGPVDVWHFAHRHKKSIAAVKAAVQTLVDDHILVHVPTADHLTDHFDVD